MMPPPRQHHTESPITSEWHCLQSNLASWERETLLWGSGWLRKDRFFIPQKALAEYKISHSPLILGTAIEFTRRLIWPKNTALCATGLCPESWQTTQASLPSMGVREAPPRKRPGARKENFAPSFLQPLCLQDWGKASWHISREQIISSLGISF